MIWIAQLTIGILLAAGLSWRLVFSYRRQKQRSQMQAHELLDVVRMAMPNAIDQMSVAVGVNSFSGTIDGHRFQIQTIVDTLATRKLPSWWLSVTLVEPVNIGGTFDMMMRANSAVSFSNFDLRPNSVVVPAGFPQEAGIRSDVDAEVLPVETIGKHMGMMFDPRAKELLVSPNGARVVWLMAEADRARYGVFRQADFGDVMPKAELILTLAQKLVELRAALNVDQVFSQQMQASGPSQTTRQN